VKIKGVNSDRWSHADAVGQVAIVIFARYRQPGGVLAVCKRSSLEGLKLAGIESNRGIGKTLNSYGYLAKAGSSLDTPARLVNR
jgi:hypothetical protein